MNEEWCQTLTQTNHKVWSVSQIPKYTFSRISRQKQANSGIGWSDEGFAKYSKIYNLVESDCQIARRHIQSGVVEGSPETPLEK